MGLQQKYTEEIAKYEIDDWFFSQLKTYKLSFAAEIIGQVLEVLNSLPKGDGWSQKIGGVIRDEKPLFFEIEYLNQEDDVPVFVDVHTIDVDDYLDYIIENNSIDYYLNEQIKSDSFDKSK